jgi:hypothetical protein
MRNTPLQPDLQSLIADVTRNLESTKVVSQVWKIEISTPTNTNHLLRTPDLGPRPVTNRVYSRTAIPSAFILR